MPSKDEYPLKLTQLEVIELFQKGKYWVDIDEGIVYRVFKNGKKKRIYTYIGGRYAGDEPGVMEKGNVWCKLYDKPKMRAMPVSHCVWIFKTRRTIPNGFEIHHRNVTPGDNKWNNLFCLFEMDHKKLHNGHDIIEETPF